MSTSNLDSSSSVSESADIPRFHHTPFYCEENVYLLCKKLAADGIARSDGSDLFVIFISNENKQIPLWHQKASHRADGVILWDYHAICIQKRKDSNLPHLVWDLDSSLPFPSPLSTYVSETIRPSFQLFSEFQRFFRIVHAPIFLRSFASDRRHMKDTAGNWLHPPPPHEAIVAEGHLEDRYLNQYCSTCPFLSFLPQDGTVHNLNEYMEMSSADVIKSIGDDTKDDVYAQRLGVLVSETHLEEIFSLIS